MTKHRPAPTATALLAFAGIASLCGPALAQEDPAPTLQWFECRWYDMERRMGDYFMAGYGSVWLPPVSRGYVDPRSANQNSFSAGYDPFDRFQLGKPGAETAYGTEEYFDQLVTEFHRANAEVYVDMVLNHDAGRQTSLQFQQDGGYAGFWMGPITSPFKTSTSPWGDFYAGTAAGYYQSENPGNPRYCLQKGDLVGLIDIDHGSTFNFIRQPVAAGNPLNIPAGTYFNLPDANNARFYPDQALGTDTVNNPGMWFAGALNTGSFAAPCDIAARNEPANNLGLGRFNTANPMAGDPVAENATGYLLRWTQWMLDVHHVDGFRIDAIKHMPSWFYDTYFDSVVCNRRLTPDGRMVTPYSFGESVESNDFTFDRYVRKPNGRTSGRLVAGDAFGNRDALDLNGAGYIRNVVNGAGAGSWNGLFGAHIDSTDDGYNNGTVGVNHIWSHDNGTTGDGGSAPPTPTDKQQGWFAHAYLGLRPGVKKFFHNARGVTREVTGGYWPRAGLLPVFGVTPATNAVNSVITNIVQLDNMLGRGEFWPRWTDDDLLVFERTTNTGANGYSGNALIGTNDRYDNGYDARTVSTHFPQGTVLVEYSGNATNATVDPNGDIFDTITVGAGGSVTIRVPRNKNANGVEHNKGFVIYAPAIPSATLQLVGSASSLPSEAGGPNWRRRFNALPIINTASFTVRLTTTNGQPGAPNNNNADDNAVFRLNAGYQDWNGNASHDIPYTNGVSPGYEEFVTTHQPLANTANAQGLYEQAIDATQLPEGMNFLSTMAFRKRNTWESPLFREVRQAFYVDRLPPPAQFNAPPTNLPSGTTSYTFLAKALDRTATKLHFIANPANLSNPPSLANTGNLGTQSNRFDWQRSLVGLHEGENTILLVAVEETGSASWQTISVTIGGPVCDDIDFNRDGLFPDTTDIDDFLSVFSGGPCSTGTCGDTDFNNDGLFPDTADIDSLLSVFSGGPCL